MIYHHIKKIVGPLIILVVNMSCTNLQDTFSDFSKVPEATYVGAADTIITQSGKEKVRFSIVYNADPKISKGTLRILNDSLSLQFPIVRKHTGKDTVLVDLDIKEGTYRFITTLMDDYGNKSLEKSILVTVLGESYIKTLISKQITSVQFQKPNEAGESGALVSFGKNHDGLQDVRIMYQDSSGAPREVMLGKFNSSIILSNFMAGGKVLAETIYAPLNPFSEFKPLEPSEAIMPVCNQLAELMASVNAVDFGTVPKSSNKVERVTVNLKGCLIEKLTLTTTAPFGLSTSEKGPFATSISLESPITSMPVYISYTPPTGTVSTHEAAVKVSAKNLVDKTLVNLIGKVN